MQNWYATAFIYLAHLQCELYLISDEYCVENSWSLSFISTAEFIHFQIILVPKQYKHNMIIMIMLILNVYEHLLHINAYQLPLFEPHREKTCFCHLHVRTTNQPAHLRNFMTLASFFS